VGLVEGSSDASRHSHASEMFPLLKHTMVGWRDRRVDTGLSRWLVR